MSCKDKQVGENLLKGFGLAVQVPFRWDEREGWTFGTCAVEGHLGGEGGGGFNLIYFPKSYIRHQPLSSICFF